MGTNEKTTMNNYRLSKLFDLLEKTFLGRLNLREKLTVGNMAITFLAILIMGMYVYVRTRSANVALTTQVEQSISSKAEETLLSTSNEQAALLNNFFASMSSNTSIVGSTISDMFLNRIALSDGSYWNARETLSRLPSGNLDNPNTEIASIFLPANMELTNAIAAKLNIIKYSELFIPSILADNPDIIAIYFGGVSRETVYYPNIDLAALVPPDFDVTSRPWYVNALPVNNAEGKVVWSTPYQDAALNGLVITTSLPVYDSGNILQGVAAMDIQLNQITSLVSNIQVGSTGYAILVDAENRLIALPQAGYTDFGITTETEIALLGEVLNKTALTGITPGVFEVLNIISTSDRGVNTVTFSDSERYVAYQLIPEVGYKLVIIVPQEELLSESSAVAEQIARETRNTIGISLALIVVIFAAATYTSLAIGNRLTSPLKSLIRVADEITSGNLNAKAEASSQDELGTLANTLNTMTATLRDSIQTLEQRVEERTAELQEALIKGERRGKQYEAIARVSQAINTTQNLQDLLPQIAEVISEQFGFYHVGIFLNDTSNQYSVLGAANSEGGQQMLLRGHQLKIGEQGIVGYVTGTGKPRIALDVGTDVTYFNNPDLPETHSEMALPLSIGGSIIGALDVQSIETNAFTEEDIEVLTTLADQVSLAIQNARLYDQMQRSLAEAEVISRQYFSETWKQLSQDQTVAGFRYTTSGTMPLTENESTEAVDNIERKSVTVPINIRGQAIGKLSVLVPKQERIKSDQMELIQAVADRVAIFAENARLFDQTTRRAERERLVTDITTKIRGSNDPQEMLKTAVEELKRALNVSRIEIVPQRITPPDR
jgi:GAF domain-containing protein/HAMP domain-containing protein